jgi:hypothetical protein
MACGTPPVMRGPLGAVHKSVAMDTSIAKSAAFCLAFVFVAFALPWATIAILIGEAYNPGASFLGARTYLLPAVLIPVSIVLAAVVHWKRPSRASTGALHGSIAGGSFLLLFVVLEYLSRH